MVTWTSSGSRRENLGDRTSHPPSPPRKRRPVHGPPRPPPPPPPPAGAVEGALLKPPPRNSPRCAPRMARALETSPRLSRSRGGAASAPSEPCSAVDAAGAAAPAASPAGAAGPSPCAAAFEACRRARGCKLWAECQARLAAARPRGVTRAPVEAEAEGACRTARMALRGAGGRTCWS